MKTCPECEGSGVVDEGTDDERQCPTCGGLGFVADDEGDDAVEIGTLYRKARTSIVDSVKFSIEAGMRLIAKKVSLEHGEWLPWLKANADTLGFEGRATATRLMKLASNVAPAHHLEAPEALRISRELWGNDNIRGTQGTGENEWFTPLEYIKLARGVLGDIDLDPASSDEAQRIIQAAQYFTKADDGLKQEWRGRVWLNPPYAQPFIAEFASKMVAERCAGRVEAGEDVGGRGSSCAK